MGHMPTLRCMAPVLHVAWQSRNPSIAGILYEFVGDLYLFNSHPLRLPVFHRYSIQHSLLPGSRIRSRQFHSGLQ